MHERIPSYAESSHYQGYLQTVDRRRISHPESVVPMSMTEQTNRLLMHG